MVQEDIMQAYKREKQLEVLHSYDVNESQQTPALHDNPTNTVVAHTTQQSLGAL